MTTLMLILGMVPIALGQGPGSGARGSLARVIIGGQALSLLITLLITPVAYSLFDDLGRRWIPMWTAVMRRRLGGLGAWRPAATAERSIPGRATGDEA
jgi:HAE1 family hydrophobic/amphiphilic exporter-1